jgi:adenine-specific DNA-methyltransferase
MEAFVARKRGEKSKDAELSAKDYRHEGAKRKNIPPAGLAAQGEIREKPPIGYSYNPHLLG